MATTVTPQQLVEHALAASSADDCVVIVRATSSANLRWANNTLTTNGVMVSSDVTVISFVGAASGTATGSVSGSASTREQADALVRAADAAARAATPAEDTADLVADRTSPDWDDGPGAVARRPSRVPRPAPSAGLPLRTARSGRVRRPPAAGGGGPGRGRGR